MSLHLNDFISGFTSSFPSADGLMPWEISASLSTLLEEMITGLDNNFFIKDGIAIHRTATVEAGAVLKAPVIIGANSFVAAHAYLRGGVYIGERCTIGPGCELKSSIVLDNTCIAHFNFVGDSIIGRQVNMEAGAIIANHYNERPDKNIWLLHQSQLINTGTEKFGAVIGDGCKIGANSVISPGSLLPPNTIVRRLELYENSQ